MSISDKDNLKKGTTQLGMHSVRNLLGHQEQMSLFSEHDKSFASEFGIQLESSIDRFGIELTDIQSRVLEGLLHGFTQTDYQGNIMAKSKSDLALSKYAGKLPETYRYIKAVPCLKATQAQLLEWSGMKSTSVADKERAVEAVKFLGSQQFCFYYDRLAYDEHGVPIKSAQGKWKKEEVTAVDKLFTIKEVRDEGSQKLKYYEIMPSPIFLDQRESYFLLIPYNWREEVQSLVGRKRISSYTFRFLLFLRYQYEKKRRAPGQKSPYTLKWSSEEIAMALKMPESMYKRKKKRTKEVLDEAYSIAKELGYLENYSRDGLVDTLLFRDEKYYNPRQEELSKSNIDKSEISSDNPEAAIGLFEYFHNVRKQLDQCHSMPNGAQRNKQIRQFSALLKSRDSNDIKELIDWVFSRAYWCTKVLTPGELDRHFSAAWTELQVSKGKTKEGLVAQNKKLAMKAEKIIMPANSKVKLAAYSDCLSISRTDSPHSEVFSYEDRDFIDKVRAAFIKWEITVPKSNN